MSIIVRNQADIVVGAAIKIRLRGNGSTLLAAMIEKDLAAKIGKLLCPRCGSPHIEGEARQPRLGFEQDLNCLDCDHEWNIPAVVAAEDAPGEREIEQ